jgi:hypothetical protein
MPFDPEKKKAYDAKYRASHKEEMKRYLKDYYKKNPEVLKKKERNRIQKLRHEVIEAYGAACVCCGETKFVFLTIDHIMNDGAEHRRELFGNRVGRGGGFYRWLKKEGFPRDRFQLMCYNCNCGRARNGGICPHQEGCS